MGTQIMTDLNQLYEAILRGKLEEAVSLTRQAIFEGIAPQELIDRYMTRAMEDIGADFEAGKAFVPNLLMSARAMKGALELLKPLMGETGGNSLGKLVIGTVKGDLHDIGKNLVASMLEGCGFQVINLGVDVSAEQFMEAVCREKADIICMSALLTTTMNYMQEVVEAVERAGLRDRVKIMVGGAPLNEAFARKIGADGYSANANSAVALARKLVGAAC